ncbi:MAG: znuA [Rickettsiales bacterium]|jgi:zinc transport system substrate-binding protein|nr:znuA [Rickettsiales bacterium]
MLTRRFASLIVVFLSLLVVTPAYAGDSTPRIVVSIKPIHSLVASVADGVAEPVLLLDGKKSEHHYTLKPSDAKALANADLVFLVSYDLETFLERPLASLSKQARVVSLIDAKGVTVLPRRKNNLWTTVQQESSHTEAAHDEDHDHDGHEHRGKDDLHIWLEPNNAIAMLKEIAAVLKEVDPTNASAYEKNAADAIARVYATDGELKKQLGFYTKTPYMVLHDGYQYFESHYGLNAIGAITLTPEMKPGAKRIRQIKELIANQGVACVFTEPQMSPSTVIFLAEQASVNMGEIDPLGLSVPAGKGAYETILKNIGNNLVKCFVDLRLEDGVTKAKKE